MQTDALYPPPPVIAQPAGSALGPPPGSIPENGVTIRLLQDNQTDAEFAGKLTVEGFRGKFVHNVTERKYGCFITDKCLILNA